MADCISYSIDGGRVLLGADGETLYTDLDTKITIFIPDFKSKNDDDDGDDR